MADYPYQPPERQFADTMLTFRDWSLVNSGVVARVEPDPLGDVNKIVRLMRGGKPVKSVLARVPAGATVRLEHNEGTPWIRYWIDDWNPVGEEPSRGPGWSVKVDGETVLAITDAEIHLRTPFPPAPRVPLWRRMRQGLREQVRADVDAIAGRLGFHRDDECGGDR